MFFCRYPKRGFVITSALALFSCSDETDVAENAGGELELGVAECSNYSTGLLDSEGTWSARIDGEYDPPARLGVVLQDIGGFALLKIYGCVLRPGSEMETRPEIRTFNVEFALPSGAQEDVPLSPGVAVQPGRIYALYTMNESADQDVYSISGSSTGTATISVFEPFESHIEGTFDVNSMPFALIEDDDQPINVQVDFALDW